MIIYNVTVNIDASVHDEWMQWMKTTHIPDIMKTGCFIDQRMLKIVSEDHENTYSIQYSCNTMNDYLKYEHHHAATLREDHNNRYKDKFVAFRTLLEVVS